MQVCHVPEYHKDFEIITLQPDDIVSEAVELLSQYNIGVLPIVDEDRIVVGVFSERDVITKVVGLGKKPEEVNLKDVMTLMPDTVRPDEDVYDAIFSTIKGGYRHLIITDDKNQLLSVLSHRDLATVLWDEISKYPGSNELTLRDMLGQKKSNHLITISSNKTIADVIDVMSKGNFGAIPVVEDNKLVGIITERDVINRVIQKRFNKDESKISEFMTRNPDTVTPNVFLKEILESGVFRRYRHLLIVDDKSENAMDNILSLRDFVDIPYSIMRQLQEN